MVVRAVGLAAVLPVLALFRFEELWMVFLLLPAVGVLTLVLVGTAIMIRGDEVARLPVGAHLGLVSEDAGLSSVVLPIVGINTDLSVMVVLPIWAPDSLEMEHVEVHVDLHLLDQLHRELILAVRKGAELFVLALGVLNWVQER